MLARKCAGLLVGDRLSVAALGVVQATANDNDPGLPASFLQLAERSEVTFTA